MQYALTDSLIGSKDMSLEELTTFGVHPADVQNDQTVNQRTAPGIKFT